MNNINVTESTCSYPGRPISGYITPNMPVYAIDEKVSFSCRLGYRLDGDSESMCGEKGEFSSAVPKCTSM